jgi:16S rRNA processing protein RimM
VSTSAWISVGRLQRTRGRAGEFIAEIDSDEPGRAERLHHVLLRKPPLESTFQVADVWYHGDRPILRFVGIDSISAAEPWERAEILVPPEERILPEEGAFLHSDLIGCVVTQGDRVLGTVESVEEYGGPSTLRLVDQYGRERLIPFVRPLCPEIDVAGKRIVVELPEGLADL